MKTTEEIISLWKSIGLLVRTVQLKDLGNNFMDLNDTIEEACEKYPNNGYYGPKRKWSIGHSSIAPIFYKMGEKGCAFPRHLAILVDPSFDDWSRYTAISSQDESSNFRFIETDRLLKSDDANDIYKKILAELISKENQNQNSEVVTCGFNINSFCGLLFEGTVDCFNQMAPTIVKELKVLSANGIKSVPIFKYSRQGNKTILTYWKELHI